MSATVIPFPARQAGTEAPQPPEAIPAAAARPQPKAALPGKRQPSRWPLPCGRNSRWKKPLHGHAVPRAKKRKPETEGNDNDA